MNVNEFLLEELGNECVEDFVVSLKKYGRCMSEERSYKQLINK